MRDAVTINAAVEEEIPFSRSARSDPGVTSGSGPRLDAPAPPQANEPALLLATKLVPPAPRTQLIDRAALMSILSAQPRRKLVLLSAPAGWGKTTLLAQWALQAAAGWRFAWLSLDSSDSDPSQFWTCVVAALQAACPGAATRTFELLGKGVDPGQAVLPTLLNELAAIEHEVAVILDDYHLVSNPIIQQQVAFLIERMPPNIQLVLATRSDPLLPLAGLRAGGDLLEIRTDDLRLHVDEADRMLAAVLGRDLSDADIRLLLARTEGWAAGLYLAGLSLAGRADAAGLIRSFAGDNRHVVDYLIAEVLEGQPTNRRTFLLRTSVLRKLTANLCDAVLQTDDSAPVLADVERHNLFLLPLDLSRRWYRYHHLFAELLQAELHRTDPALVPTLHNRAATWFEREGLIDEAAHHLMAAGDVERLAELVAAHWAGDFYCGRWSTVSAWLDLLPPETVAADPRLGLARAWIVLARGLVDEAQMWIGTVEAALASAGAEREAMAAAVVVLRAVHAFTCGDLGVARDAAREATELVRDDAPLSGPNAHGIYGSTLYFAGRTREAQAAYRRAVQLAEKTGNQLTRIYALGYLALIAVEDGHVADAEQLIRKASGGGSDLADEEHFVDATVSLATAKVLDMRGETAAALDVVERAVMLGRLGGRVPELANALAIKAEILRHAGDHEAALVSLNEADVVLGGRADIGTTPKTPTGAGTRVGTVGGRVDGRVSGDDLTSKEIEVLRLLATRLSRREIGERLYISLNTVKSHQRSLYRKLAVTDRNTAVHRARELGLL